MSEDWDLVERARHGEEAAYGDLIARYQNPIYSFIFRSVGQEGTARDLAQETFVRAWFALPKLKPGGKFSTWLFQVALNLCRDHLKSKVARQGQITETLAGERPDNERELADSGLAPDECAERAEAVAELEAEIRDLPNALREPFVLGAVEGYSHEEIGKTLDISPKSVETRIYRARKFLMERVAKIRGEKGRD